MKTNKLIVSALLLSVFGMAAMTGCETPEVKYRVPAEDRYADFTITGTVTDEDGNPIPFITVAGSWLYDDPPKNSPVETDANGAYSIRNQEWKTGTLNLYAYDNSAFNGGDYRADPYNYIEVDGNEYVGGDGKGYGGVYSKTVDFTLIRLGDEDVQK